MTDAILVINAGSSSLKFSLFPAGRRPSRQDLVCEGAFAGIRDRAHFTAKDGAGARLADMKLKEGRPTRTALWHCCAGSTNVCRNTG